MATITASASCTLSLSNGQSASGNAYFTADIPQGAEIISATASGTWSKSGSGNVSQVYVAGTSVASTFSNIAISSEYIDAGYIPVSASPQNRRSVNVTISITITINYSVATIPIITVGTPSRAKISSVPGYDQVTVTFQCDKALQEWEARATLPGITSARGVGLLVESGTALAANTDATVYVDDEELTNGDNQYTITVYGHDTDGYWSDGSFESDNILDLSTDVPESGWATISGDSVIFDTGTSNTEGGEVKVQLFTNQWGYVSTELWAEVPGLKTVNITRSNTFDWVQLATNGDYVDAYIMIDASIMDMGETYALTFTIDSMSTNHAEISGISLVKVVV